MKKNNRKQPLSKKIGYIGTSLGIVYILLTWASGRYTPADLKDLNWKKDPGNIVISDIYRNESDRNKFYKGILALNLRDGKEQFIAGDWKVNLTNKGNIFAYGKFPAGYSDQKSQQLYYILQAGNIYNIDLNGNRGDITFAAENDAGNYMALKMTKGNSDTFCVSPTPGIDKEPSCFLQFQSLSHASKGLWNPDQDHELVIKNSANTFYTYDPLKDSHPQRVDPKSESFQRLDDLLKKGGNMYSLKSEESKKLYSFLNFVITRETTGWSLFRIPLSAKTARLADREHLLIKERNQLSIVELGTRKKSILLKELAIGKKPLQFHKDEFDEVL